MHLPELSDLVEIGRGGYGVVCRAWQEQLRRKVTIKALAVRLDGHAVRRFAQECRALGTASGQRNVSPIPKCLGLPTLPAGSQQNVSGVSCSASPGYSQPGKYLVV